MTNSKVIQVLKTFSKQEIKEFDKFISSPYFGCRKFVAGFFKILKKYHPEFRPEDINKERLFDEMYKGRKYNDGLMRRIFSEILKYSEEYIMISRLYKTKVYRNNCLLMELRDRNLNRSFRQKAGTVLKGLEERKDIDYYYLLDKHLTEIEMYNDLIQHNRKQFPEKLDLALRSLILFFLNSYYSVSENHKKHGFQHSDEVVKAFMNSIDNKSFIDSLGKSRSGDVILIKAIYYSNKITVENDVSGYLKLKNILSKNSEIISPQQKMIFYNRLFTFYGNYNLINDDRFLRNQINDYRTVLKEKLFLVLYSHISKLFVRNYVNACNLSLKYNAIKNFITDYTRYFYSEDREGLTNYCLAFYYSGKRQFGRSLENSSKVKMELPVFKLDIKILKIKCYFELGYTDSLFSEIDTLKHFLKNTESLKKENISSVKNFLKFITRILNRSDIKTGKNIFVLRKEIENEMLLTEKKWLLIKLKELEK